MPLRRLGPGGFGHALLTMKVLNRNQYLPMGCPMRGVRAAIVSSARRARAVGLHAARLHRSPSGQPRSDLDSPWPMASPIQHLMPPSLHDRPGRFRRRHQCASRQPCGFAAKRLCRRTCRLSRRRPSRSMMHAYRLDAGDKLRVVVYGQEGLTNTYAIDAGGSITMPLIGSVPRARTNAGGACRRDHGQTAQRLYPRSLGGGGGRNPIGRSSSSAKSRPPANILMCPI